MCVGRSDSVMREQKGDSEVTRKPQWAIFWGGSPGTSCLLDSNGPNLEACPTQSPAGSSPRAKSPGVSATVKSKVWHLEVTGGFSGRKL